jgi:hypothetical protein
VGAQAHTMDNIGPSLIEEFISPHILRFLATNLHNKTLQEHKTMHTNCVDALLRKLPFPFKGESSSRIELPCPPCPSSLNTKEYSRLLNLRMNNCDGGELYLKFFLTDIARIMATMDPIVP